MSNCEQQLQQLFLALDRHPATEHAALRRRWLAQHPQCASLAQTWLLMDERLRAAPLQPAPDALAIEIVQAVLEQRRHDRRVLAGLTVVGGVMSLLPTLLLSLALLIGIGLLINPAIAAPIIGFLLASMRGVFILLSLLTTLAHTLSPWLLPLLLLTAGGILTLVGLGLSRNLSPVRAS